MRLDDKVTRHPKLLACSVEARWLYVVCLCHCAEFGTDGRIAGANLRTLTAGLKHPVGAVDELVDNGLLEQVGGRLEAFSERTKRGLDAKSLLQTHVFEVHHYLEYNPSKAQRVEAARKAGRRSGEVRKQARAELTEVNVEATGRSSDVPNDHSTARSSNVALNGERSGNDSATIGQPRARVPSRPPVLLENKETKERGDVHMESPPRVPTDLKRWADWHQLSESAQVGRVMDFLPAKRGDNQTLDPEQYQHELAIAKQIVHLAIPGPDLKKHLEAWWDETDPDDRPLSLEYFWTRLQQLESEGLKQPQRPHVDSGFTKAGESLPDIQSKKGTKA